MAAYTLEEQRGKKKKDQGRISTINHLNLLYFPSVRTCINVHVELDEGLFIIIDSVHKSQDFQIVG